MINLKSINLRSKMIYVYYIFLLLCVCGCFYYYFIMINSKTVNVINSTINMKYGEVYQNKLDLGENVNYNWESSNPNLVSVDDTGKISVNSNEDGEVIVKAISEEHQVLANIIVKVSRTDTILNITSLNIKENEISLKYGETKKINVVISPSNATNKKLIWTSNNSSLVSVDGSGNLVVNSNKDGEAVITVKAVDGNFTDSVKVKVKSVDKINKVNGINIVENEISLKYGETKKINVVISPSNATNKKLIWTSNNSNLVSVDGSGNLVVNSNKDGEAVITVKAVDGNFTDSVKVKVKSVDKINKVNGVKLNENQITLGYGKTFNLIATVSPTNATNKNVIWQSDNINVATVSANGIVTAVGAGKANITVITNDGNYKASCTVVVNRKTYTVNFNSNGGSSVSKQSVLEGNKVNQPTEPKRQGYIFNGWLLNNSKYDFNKNITSNITLVASWRIDYKAVDYCSNMSVSFEKDGIKLKKCINDFVISKDSSRKKKFMQNFSITSKYIYFISPLNGAWLTGYSKSDLSDTKKYNAIVDSAGFEKISSVFIERVDKNTGNSKLMEVKYSGHGQGFDTVSGDNDVLYLTAIAHPTYSNELLGASSVGISYTSFKENGGIRVPGVTIAFKSNGAVFNRITSTSFMQNGVFNSNAYYQQIKQYSKNSSLIKNIVSMAIDEKKDRLAYSIGKNVYIYSLSKVKNGTATGAVKHMSLYSNQGLELYGDNLYIVTNKDSVITIYKYSISSGKKIKSIEINFAKLYQNRVKQGSVIEAEGLSIYNGKLYLGIVSRENKIGYNDIYLVENFI